MGLESSPHPVWGRLDPATLLCSSHGPSLLVGGPHSVIPPGRNDSWLWGESVSTGLQGSGAGMLMMTPEFPLHPLNSLSSPACFPAPPHGSVPVNSAVSRVLSPPSPPPTPGPAQPLPGHSVPDQHPTGLSADCLTLPVLLILSKC